jgi:heptosyltransferase-2
MVKLTVPGKKFENILVRGVNWVGDAVMTMPAIRALKLANPDSKITLLVKPRVSPLFERDPNIDAIILYSDEYKGLRGRIKLARRLREYHFDCAVLLQNAFDSAFITSLAGIPERIGYNRDARGFFLTKAVSFDDHAKSLHHIEYYMNLLEGAGFTVKKSMPWIHLSLEERQLARRMLNSLQRPVIAINPGAAYGSSKRWGTGRFAETAERIIDELKGSVVILGGPSETAISEEIARMLLHAKPEPGMQNRHLLFMAGRMGLRELMALIAESDLLVTNDSGPMHIGYAVGTPVVAVFGSTSPELTGPVGDDSVVIRKEVDCSPCFERECRMGDFRCMDLVGSGEVYNAIKRLVKSKKAVFFDRDGTLCKDTGYLNKMEDLEIFPDLESLEKLKAEGFSLIGVSNQSGVARGIVDEDFVERVNRTFIDQYGFEGFYYCPHHPDERCSCRKPEPGLLIRARCELNIDLKSSFVVGDKESDMLLAKAVGARAIFVKTGQERSSQSADFEAANLKDAAHIILNLNASEQIHMRDAGKAL